MPHPGRGVSRTGLQERRALDRQQHLETQDRIGPGPRRSSAANDFSGVAADLPPLSRPRTEGFARPSRSPRRQPPPSEEGVSLHPCASTQRGWEASDGASGWCGIGREHGSVRGGPDLQTWVCSRACGTRQVAACTVLVFSTRCVTSPAPRSAATRAQTASCGMLVYSATSATAAAARSNSGARLLIQSPNSGRFQGGTLVALTFKSPRRQHAAAPHEGEAAKV